MADIWFLKGLRGLRGVGSLLGGSSGTPEVEIRAVKFLGCERFENRLVNDFP